MVFFVTHTTGEGRTEASAKRPHKEEMSIEERYNVQMLVDKARAHNDVKN